LVFEADEAFEARLVAIVRERASGVSIIDALRTEIGILS
jgi:hypothetical protein